MWLADMLSRRKNTQFKGKNFDTIYVYQQLSQRKENVLVLNIRKWTIITIPSQGAGSIYFQKSRINRCWRSLPVESRGWYMVLLKIWDSLWGDIIVCEVSHTDFKIVKIHITWNKNPKRLLCFEKIFLIWENIGQCLILEAIYFSVPGV